MSIEGLEHFTKDQLIDELINRQTFVGLVVYHREDAKAKALVSGEIVMTKSPPLSREGVEQLLQMGQTLVPQMFGEAKGPADAFPPLLAAAPPLRRDEGAIRVGQSRICLDLVVEQYESGVTPEEMVRAYDTLSLADVYSAIAFYLQHRDQVRDYLSQRADEARALQAAMESERPRITREELLRRRAAQEQEHASSGQ